MKFQANLVRCGDNLRQIREKQRMTINALAVLSGVDPEVISLFELGSGGGMALTDLLRLTEVLGVELTAIFI
jgi:transcriptional regulator with XRE-family HTH domain